jgi:RNA polymerase sigma-70 factor (ECF subfamily)
LHPNPEALAMRMCVHAAYDVLRRKIRRQRWDALALVRRWTQPETPADAAVRDEQECAVREAIGMLSRNQATAVTLRLAQGLSYGDIGRVLGCQENTVRKHVERGRQRLKELLRPWLGGGLKVETIQ